MLKQITIFLENRAGALSSVTSLLSENGIDLRALLIAEATDYGLLRIIVNDTEKAERVLKENGTIVDVSDVVAVSVPDKPGGLASLLSLIEKNGIDVSYMYSVFSANSKGAIMVLKVTDTQKLEEVLKENGIKSAEIKDLI